MPLPRIVRCLTVAVFVSILPQRASAGPFVESISPPVLEVGKTGRVTLVGRELANAEGLWFSTPEPCVTARPIESSAERAVFEVTATKAAPVGVVGVRVATRNGLGNACLMVIDDLPVRASATGGQPAKLALPAAVWGTLGEAVVDRYAIDVAAGTKLSFEAVANRLGKDSDPLVIIRSPDGKILAERDNDPGFYFDCRFEHTFAQAGTYTVEIRDARYQGDAHHKYVLRVGAFPAGRLALPSESKPGPPGWAFHVRRGEQGSAWVPVPTSQAPVTAARTACTAEVLAESFPLALGVQALQAHPLQGSTALLLWQRFPPTRTTPATVPGELWGTIAEPGVRTAFALPLAKGQKVYIRGEAKALNSPADPELFLQDRAGRDLYRTGDAEVETPFAFTAPDAGVYRLAVRDKEGGGGPDFAFRVVVRTEPFPPQLTAEVEGLTVPRGSYQPVPILVKRTGPTGRIKLVLRGAPTGVRLTPTEIADNQDAIVCRLEADAAAPLGLHTVQIAAEIPGPHGPESVFVTTQPLIDHKKVNVDLIPYALREDQLRLPPTVADRFALFVTPLALFTFELPAAVVTLPRYQSAPISVVTTRVPGFDGPIRFEAIGGQLADKNEGRTRVYAEFPEATAGRPITAGRVVSKILSNIGKPRIEVHATGTHEGRQVTLIRCFDLDLVPAFKVVPEPAMLTLQPGQSGTVRFRIDRVPSFDGPVSLQLSPLDGLAFAETVTAAKGQTSVDLKLSAPPTATPRRGAIQAVATGTVDGYEEEVRVQQVEIEVKAPAPKKDK